MPTARRFWPYGRGEGRHDGGRGASGNWEVPDDYEYGGGCSGRQEESPLCVRENGRPGGGQTIPGSRRVGDACLELHSHKTTRSRFYSELRRTLELPPIRTQDGTESFARVDTLRNQLNEYCRSLHAPIEGTGLTPYLALGKLCKLDTVSRGLPKAEFSGISCLDSLRFKDLLAKVRALQSTVAENGCPVQNPFFDMHPSQMLPSDLQSLAGLLSAADTSLRELTDATRSLADHLRITGVDTAKSIRDLTRLAQFLTGLPTARSV